MNPMRHHLKNIVLAGFIIAVVVIGGAPAVLAQQELGTDETSRTTTTSQDEISGAAQTTGASTNTSNAGNGTYVPLAKIPGLTDIQPTKGGLASFFNNLYKYAIGLAAVLAVIMIIWGGLEYSTQDSISKKSDGKERIQEAILGLILVLSPALVFSIINPGILNLSINLQELDTRSGNVIGGNGGGTTQTTQPTTTQNGCSVTGTLFKKASCSTADAAKTFAASCTTGVGTVLPCQTENSAGCADRVYFATCDSSRTKSTPYVFLDTSYTYNPVIVFSSLRPLAATPNNPTNGADALRYAATCIQDGGVVCHTGTTVGTSFTGGNCTYSSVQPTSQTNKCYSLSLSCEKSSVGASVVLYCSSSPSWTPIQ
jgi:hypothetical protein